MHAMQTTVATTEGSSLGSLAFAREMFWKCRWLLIGRPLHMLVNISKMIIYNVPIGSDARMTKLQDNKFWKSARPTKLGVRTEGPSTIERVHVNGNLIILLREGITKGINIRRVLLCCWPFYIPLWRQFLAWIVLRVFTFYIWSFFSTSHSSEL